MHEEEHVGAGQKADERHGGNIEDADDQRDLRGEHETFETGGQRLEFGVHGGDEIVQ